MIYFLMTQITGENNINIVGKVYATYYRKKIILFFKFLYILNKVSVEK